MSRRPKINPGAAMTERPCANAIARLLARCDIQKRGCWVWQGCTDARGYGRIKAFGKPQWVHRLSYVIFNGPLADGQVVHHTCHNTPYPDPEPNQT